MFDSLKNSEDQTKSILSFLLRKKKQLKSATYPLLLISTGRKEKC